MKKIYAFLCETNLVAFFAAFDASVFEKWARKQGFKPRTWRLYALIGYTGAAVFLLLASVVLFAAAKHFYLERCGTDAVGTVTGRSFYTYTERRGSKTPKEILTYEFTTPQGRTVKNSLDLAVRDLSGLPAGNRITVAYWERFPIINAPRGVRWGNEEATVLGFLVLFMSWVFARLARLQTAWARSLSRQPPVPVTS
jgi:hypothetical protein